MNQTINTWSTYRSKYNKVRPQTLEEELDVVDEQLHKTYIAGALARNDLAHLRLLLSNKGIDYVDDNRMTHLHEGVHCYSLEAFDCLLSIPGVPINALDIDGQTALVWACRLPRFREGALALIRAGADVNLGTPLHEAITIGDDELSHALIEKGADINAGNSLGETPLFVACKLGRLEIVCMLLYYGADVSIPNCVGRIPFNEADYPIQEILFDYVFDERGPICLSVFAKHIPNNSSLVPKLFETATEVYYELRDLTCLCANLLSFTKEYFVLFIERYHYIVKDMFLKAWMFTRSIFTFKKMTSRSLDNLLILTESDIGCDLIDVINRSKVFNSILPSIYEVADVRAEVKIKLIMSWVSQGLKFDSDDVDTIYLQYGFSPVFKRMLEIDFDKTNKQVSGHLMPRLIYDFTMSMDRFLERKNFFSSSMDLVLEFFSDARFKEYCRRLPSASINSNNLSVTEKLKMLPDVPLLVELSRNAARSCLIDTYKIKNWNQFCHILRMLVVPNAVVQILTYEKKLYQLN